MYIFYSFKRFIHAIFFIYFKLVWLNLSLLHYHYCSYSGIWYSVISYIRRRLQNGNILTRYTANETMKTKLSVIGTSCLAVHELLIRMHILLLVIFIHCVERQSNLVQLALL